MHSLLCLFSLFIALCHAAALPKLPETGFNALTSEDKDDHVPALSLSSQFERRSVENSSLVVSLELIDSGYCGNISVGSQDTSILTLFDLSASQLSALSSDVQYCPNSDQCSSPDTAIHRYDPSLSETATDLTESFEIDISSTTLSGVVYEDSISIGGLSIARQSFGLARKIRGSHTLASSNSFSYGGVAGLSGCANSSENPASMPSFIESLFSNDHIQTPGFSLWMNPLTLMGEILFGAIDSTRYMGALYLFDLVNPTSGYSVYLEKILSTAGGITLTFPQIEMVFDTTIFGVILPQSWKSNMITLFSGAVDQNSTLLIPCALNTSSIEVDFVLGNGFTISIPISAFVGVASSETADMCLSPFSFTDSSRYALGSSFLQYVYLVLNTKTSQGAIARANFSTSTSNLVAMTPNTPFPGAIVFDTTIVETSSNSSAVVSNALTANGTSTVTTAVLLATTGAVVTETIVTTVTEGTSASVLTNVVTSTVTSRTVNGLVASASTSISSATLTTPADTHLGTTSISSSVATTSRTVDGLVASASTSTGATIVSSGATVSTSSTSRTIAGIVATADTSVTTDPSQTSSTTDPVSSTSSSISRTNGVLIVTSAVSDTSVTTVAPASTTNTSGIATGPGSETTKSVEGVSVSSGSPTTTTPSRNTNVFNVPFTSASYSMSPGPPSPWPSGINVNIYIQNNIILTTTHRYAPDNFVDVVTVTSTATVTTTVPCSTDPAKTDTVTAKVLQLLIVPSPTPYVDDECSCTKTNIVYVDQQSLTKTIWVQAATPLLSPTQQADTSQCDCEDCYYTVKRTKTVTAYCTSTPVSPNTALPTFISGGDRLSAVYGCSSIFALAMAMAIALLR